jgi:hypothetical protein
MKRIFRALVFFIWMGFILSAFYGVQKPLLMTMVKGVAGSLWTIAIWLILIMDGLGIGNFLFQKVIRISLQPVERVLLGGGIGLGTLGFAGFLLGLFGWTSPIVLISIQLGLFLVLRQVFSTVINDLRETSIYIYSGMIPAPLWVKIAVGSTLLFAFLLAIAPPADAFDALFYHLVEPQRIINNAGLQPSSIPHSWFPALPEGIFLVAQSAGSVRATQLLHLTWAIYSILLIWYWAKTVWNEKIARTALVIIISMPSFYLLASWAYTDFTLTFFGLVGIYAVFKAFQDIPDQPQLGWIILSGVSAGMAMGVKYTSFLVPVSIVILIILWNKKNLLLAAKLGGFFILIAVLVASPWYIRNWVVMGNPFYPFIFGGQYWDEFRANWYAQPGTGIGWNLRELILLPLNATLGHRDANYYDGRIGPLYLILAPLTLYYLLTSKQCSKKQKNSLNTILLFSLLSFLAWTLGVINSSALWQTRLLFPALIPFALTTALGFLAIENLDTPKLNLSFIFNFFLIIIVAINLIDATIFVTQRNPLASALGLEPPEAYLSRVQPGYAQAVELLDQTPVDAKIYMILEPRSYYMNRDVQPDPILDNFAHDFYLYDNPNNIFLTWQSDGYTHVLLYRRGLEYLADNNSLKFTKEHQAALDDLIQDHLNLISKTADGAYELYEINPGQ